MPQYSGKYSLGEPGFVQVTLMGTQQRAHLFYYKGQKTMGNEDDRGFTLIKDGMGIKVDSDKKENVVLVNFEGTATVFLDPKVAVAVGSEIIEESMRLFGDKEEFVHTLVNTCAERRGEPPISLEDLEGHLKEVSERMAPYSVSSRDGRVLLNFGDDKEWLGMTPRDAKMLSKVIFAKAEQIENSKNENETFH